MKYSVAYRPDFNKRAFDSTILDQVDEIEIIYDRTDTSLLDFIKQYPKQTIILDNIEAEDIERISKIYQEYPHIKVKIDFFNFALTEIVQQAKIPFFFENKVYSLDVLADMAKMHPTDIYIVNEFGFMLLDIAKILHQNNIQVRVFPHIAQSSSFKIEDIKKFFIRPEDLKTYEDVVDICDLSFAGSVAATNEDEYTYYKIYAQDGTWFGLLNEIIYNFDDPIDNRTIAPHFGIMRKNCQKRCLRYSDSCHMCNTIAELAHTLENNHLILTSEEH